VRIHIIALREIRAMLKEKSFIFILLLETLLVSSSGLLSVGYVIMTSPESSSMLSQLSSLIYVGVVSDTPQPITQVLTEGRINYKVYPGIAQADADMRNGIVDAIVMGDISFSGNQTVDMRPAFMNVFLPANSPKVPLTKLALKKVLLRLEEKLREKKIAMFAPTLDFTPYKIMNFKPQANSIEIYFIFTLPLLLFLPSIISGSLVIDSITQDLESRQILNLILTPLTDSQIVFGKALASLLLSLMQSVLWLLVLSLTFMSPQNNAALIVFCGLYTVIYMNAGSILSLYLGKMKSSQILYTFVTMTSISLFTPFANIHPLLLEFSPSYMITKMALGTPPSAFAWQFTVLAIIALASTAWVFRISKRISTTIF
jgi:ABC-2 type transport system permease protein